MRSALSPTLIFIAALLGLVILFTAIITLCALCISSKTEDLANQISSHQTVDTNTQPERRRICRSDFPFICNDGSCAWSDRRKVNA